METALWTIVFVILFFQVKWVYEVFVSGIREPVTPRMDLVGRLFVSVLVIVLLLAFWPTGTSERVIPSDEYQVTKTEDMVVFSYEDMIDKVDDDPYIHSHASDTSKVELSKVTLYGYSGHVIHDFIMTEKKDESR